MMLIVITTNSVRNQAHLLQVTSLYYPFLAEILKQFVEVCVQGPRKISPRSPAAAGAAYRKNQASLLR